MAVQDVHTMFAEYLNLKQDAQQQEIDINIWVVVLGPLRAGECYRAICSTRTDQGCSVMHKAVFCKHESVASLLLSSVGTYGQKLLSLKNKTSLTPMHIAAYYGHTQLLCQLLGSFPQSTRFELLKSRSDSGQSVVHRTVLEGHTDTTECLLSLVSPVQRLQLLNAESFEGETPLKLCERRLAGMRERHRRRSLQHQQFNQENPKNWDEILQTAENTVNFLKECQRKAELEARGISHFMDGLRVNINVHPRIAANELPQQETTTQAVPEVGDNVEGNTVAAVQAY